MNKKIAIMLTIMTFVSAIINVDATTVNHAGVCEVDSVFRDDATIEEAIGKDEYRDITMGTNGLISSEDYCPVYCVEEDIFNWPGFKPTTNSGGNFTWTIGENEDKNIISGLTVRLNGRRECRTDIDLDKWLKNYNDTVKKIKEIEKNLQKDKIRICPSLGGSTGNRCGWSSSTTQQHYNTYTMAEWSQVGGNVLELMSNGGYTELNNVTGEVHSNKYTNVYSNITTSGDAYNVKVSYDVTTYEAMCCSWRPGTTATATETGVGTGVVVGESATENEGRYQQLKAVCASAGGSGYKAVDIETVSSEQIVTTQVTCSETPRQYGTRTERVCTCGTSCQATCKRSCTFNGNTNQTCYEACKRGNSEADCYDVESIDPSNYQPAKITVTAIKQEVCGGGKGMTFNKPMPCVEGCPEGYRLGTDGKCYMIDTSELERLVEYQQTLLDILAECTKLSFKYDLNTDMLVYFEEPIYGRTEELNKSKISEEQNETVKEYGFSVDNYNRQCKVDPNSDNCKKTVEFKICELGVNKSCRTEIKDISEDWIEKFGKEYLVGYEYYLPNNFYKYILMPAGKSVDNVPENSDYQKYNRFINVGYANYPVHFTTPHKEPYYNLDILFTNVGYKNKFSNDIYINQYNNEGSEIHIIQSNGEKLVYDCEYNVTDGKPYCPPLGCDDYDDDDDLGSVRLIYRPISLSNPFPSIDADGRDTGSNWCTLNSEDDEKDCSNTNDTVTKYILNNRNTQADSVYSKEPMYQITLTPSLINKIREYNKLTNYDDYNLYCSSTNPGKECRSHFVVGGMDGASLVPTFGAFTGCGTDADFYACDKRDNIER